MDNKEEYISEKDVEPSYLKNQLPASHKLIVLEKMAPERTAGRASFTNAVLHDLLTPVRYINFFHRHY